MAVDVGGCHREGPHSLQDHVHGPPAEDLLPIPRGAEIISLARARVRARIKFIIKFIFKFINIINLNLL